LQADLGSRAPRLAHSAKKLDAVPKKTQGGLLKSGTKLNLKLSKDAPIIWQMPGISGFGDQNKTRIKSKIMVLHAN
jgi:hypothetical protein